MMFVPITDPILPNIKEILIAMPLKITKKRNNKVIHEDK